MRCDVDIDVLCEKLTELNIFWTSLVVATWPNVVMLVREIVVVVYFLVKILFVLLIVVFSDVISLLILSASYIDDK